MSFIRIYVKTGPAIDAAYRVANSYETSHWLRV